MNLPSSRENVNKNKANGCNILIIGFATYFNWVINQQKIKHAYN